MVKGRMKDHRAIWKYHFRTTDEFKMSMPKGSKVLSAQTFHSVPTLLVEVDTREKDKEERCFKIFPSGQVDSVMSSIHGEFVGSYFEVKDGPIWYIFETIEDK